VKKGGTGAIIPNDEDWIRRVEMFEFRKQDRVQQQTQFDVDIPERINEKQKQQENRSFQR
jgi:hypothetical protein